MLHENETKFYRIIALENSDAYYLITNNGKIDTPGVIGIEKFTNSAWSRNRRLDTVTKLKIKRGYRVLNSATDTTNVIVCNSLGGSDGEVIVDGMNNAANLNILKSLAKMLNRHKNVCDLYTSTMTEKDVIDLQIFLASEGNNTKKVTKTKSKIVAEKILSMPTEWGDW